jgi:hypothetical protein
MPEPEELDGGQQQQQTGTSQSVPINNNNNNSQQQQQQQQSLWGDFSAAVAPPAPAVAKMAAPVQQANMLADPWSSAAVPQQTQRQRQPSGGWADFSSFTAAPQQQPQQSTQSAPTSQIVSPTGSNVSTNSLPKPAPTSGLQNSDILSLFATAKPATIQQPQMSSMQTQPQHQMYQMQAQQPAQLGGTFTSNNNFSGLTSGGFNQPTAYAPVSSAVSPLHSTTHVTQHNMGAPFMQQPQQFSQFSQFNGIQFPQQTSNQQQQSLTQPQQQQAQQWGSLL